MNEEEIASLIAPNYRKLEWLDKEDIIKRVVSLEFNRMIDYYKDADEIQQVDERSSRSERGERRAHAAEEGYSRFFLNFGKADGLYPNPADRTGQQMCAGQGAHRQDRPARKLLFLRSGRG